MPQSAFGQKSRKSKTNQTNSITQDLSLMPLGKISRKSNKYYFKERLCCGEDK